ncbi:MAG TPA: TGS domain-containing protein [Candidatus Sulfotelmatobacter sp.]|nr:TGS domain-containing protein [Candidatus Sulfotelmatobacter sp.]
MPANLTPQYLEADRRFKEAKAPEEKLAALEEMLAVIPKHKGTEHLRGDLKRRLAKLKAEAEQARKKRGGFSVTVDREGAGQVVLVGGPNTGKSALVAALTNAPTEIAEYPFTTRRPVAGMMPFVNVQVQLVDLPAFSSDYMEPWVPSLVRVADLVLLVADLASASVLEDVGRVLELLARSKIKLVRPGESAAAEVGWAVKPALLLGNKAEGPGAQDAWEVVQASYPGFPGHALSAEAGLGLEALRRAIYDGLAIVRVYSKPPGKEPSMEAPVVLPRGSTILDMAEAIHKDFARHLQYARVWGSTRFSGQRVQQDYVVQEGDVIELHL